MGGSREGRGIGHRQDPHQVEDAPTTPTWPTLWPNCGKIADNRHWSGLIGAIHSVAHAAVGCRWTTRRANNVSVSL